MARPREFDYDQVILKITEVFWAKGFKATSLDNITSATGLNKGSLYASFGNKEAIFRVALRRYVGEGPFKKIREEVPHLDSLDVLVRLYAKLISEAGVSKLGRRGCLAFNSGVEVGHQNTKLSQFVVKEVDRLESFFHELIGEAVDESVLPRKLDVKKAAFRAFAAAFAIREMAKFRPDREMLAEIANSALASLGTERRV